jgi:hypothetical protein
MPCRDDYYDDPANKLKPLDPLLCEAMDILDEHDLLDKCSKELKEWYSKHTTKEIERVKRETLAKLTRRERRLLGLLGNK